MRRVTGQSTCLINSFALIIGKVTIGRSTARGPKYEVENSGDADQANQRYRPLLNTAASMSDVQSSGPPLLHVSKLGPFDLVARHKPVILVAHQQPSRKHWT